MNRSNSDSPTDDTFERLQAVYQDGQLVDCSSTSDCTHSAWFDSEGLINRLRKDITESAPIRGRAIFDTVSHAVAAFHDQQPDNRRLEPGGRQLHGVDPAHTVTFAVGLDLDVDVIAETPTPPKDPAYQQVIADADPIAKISPSPYLAPADTTDPPEVTHLSEEPFGYQYHVFFHSVPAEDTDRSDAPFNETLIARIIYNSLRNRQMWLVSDDLNYEVLYGSLICHIVDDYDSC